MISKYLLAAQTVAVQDPWSRMPNSVLVSLFEVNICYFEFVRGRQYMTQAMWPDFEVQGVFCDSLEVSG